MTFWIHLVCLFGLVLAHGCQTSGPSERQDKLPPLVPPAENMYCPMADMGQPLPPRTPDQLSDEEIHAFMAPRMRFLRECYDERVAMGYPIEGAVGIRFFVSPEGYVQQLCLVEEGTGDAQFISCLFGEIGTWQFPRKSGRTEIRHRVGFRMAKH